MLTGQYTTVEEILERVRRDYGFEHVVSDEAIEWIWDVVNYIGSPMAFEDKLAEISISDYRGVLPLDFAEMHGVRDRDTLVALRYDTNVHYLNQNPTITNSRQNVIVGASVNLDVNGNPDTSTIITMLDPTSVRDDRYTYSLHGDYIFSGIKDATLEISYKAFPVNADGSPKIPDDARYIRAVVSYIAERIGLRLMLKDELSERKYDRLLQDYYFNVASARTKTLTPNIDMMETIKNRSLRLFPQINEHTSWFKYLGDQERLKRI